MRRITIGERRLTCVGWTLPRTHPGWIGPTPCRLVALFAPASVSAVSLAAQWGLTGREAEVAAAVIGSASIEDAADRLGIAGETVRSHLKRVFRKSGASSQADLIRRYLTGPSPWFHN